ncbi:hypothetical protein [Kribbella koreensis]|uniref:Mom family adenine methylcarbamoylation protein n=1 Tax=Kribbella koreensis TaxID=57909 RepID=UPI0031D87058
MRPRRGVLLDDCREHGSEFVRLVRVAAGKRAVEPRALAVRTLLHLPRVARLDGQLTWAQVRAEIATQLQELVDDQAKVERLMPEGRFELQDLRFVADYNRDNAEEIFTHLHYLRSARPGALNYALVDPLYGRPVSLCSVSPLEWRRVGRHIASRFEIAMDTVWDISRVYSFDVAPANAISYLLARVRSDIRRRRPDLQLLTTAVDPNLGFTGASYLAANWNRWMTIRPRPYLYYRGRYVSPRQLRTEFATTNVAELRSMHGGDFGLSRTQLLDSMIFCCRLKGETEVVPAGLQHRLHR